MVQQRSKWDFSRLLVWKLQYHTEVRIPGDAGPSGQMWNAWISHSSEKLLLVAEYLDFENAGAYDINGNDVFENSEYLSGKS